MRWSPHQWSYRFKSLWAYPNNNKQSFLLWLIIHQGLWIGPRVRKIFVDGGKCITCGRVEDVFHLFFDCVHAKAFWHPLEKYLAGIRAPNLKATDVLLGCCNNMNLLLWNLWRSNIMCSIWLSKNNKVLGKGRKNFLISLPQTLEKVSLKCIKSIMYPSLLPQELHYLLACNKYTRWKAILSQLYSQQRFDMLNSL
ncbi:hypothetical protein KP509_26G029000 [Ceratopteris richardii]|nr:hypothetical protein KP509_26G029000 [Ceratopteris richardii]